MSRAARVQSITGIYHVMLRGADRRILFSDDEDCRGFLLSLQHAKAAGGCKLYAYCLMGNHVHLLMKEEQEPLGNVIKRLSVSYVYHYNEKYDLLGHLFQDRFRSEPVNTIGYFMDVLRYICQNPVKAGLCRVPRDYRWLGCAGLKDEFNLVDDMSEYSTLNGAELISFLNKNCDEEHMDDTGRKRLTDRDAVSRLCSVCGCTRVQDIAGWPAPRREDAIKQGLKAGISYRQLSRLTGIGKTVIERIARI